MQTVSRTVKKSPKEALKSTVQKTVKKQVGGSRSRIGGVRGGSVYKKNRNGVVLSNPEQSFRKQPLLRSRSDFFFKVKYEY